jgi:D-beta-D-heptose 7-phosphate kinase / D-beta-D-heptose 1-phosphate adenosyltransferase
VVLFIMITVFTNGCFDILHAGHVNYLQQSRALGDRLIVGLNSDKSLYNLKNRCYNIDIDRKQVLEALSCVDKVIIFDEETPWNLIKEVKPDIITKGGDYNLDQVVGKELAEVRIIPALRDRSTSRLIRRIKDGNSVIG